MNNWSLAPVAAITLCGVAFALDITVPLGVAAGIPYAALALLAAFGPRARAAFLVAALATVLIGLGAWLSKENLATWIVHTNRAMAVLCVWTIAALGTRLARARRQRDESESRMQLLISMCAQCRRVRMSDDSWRELARYVEESFGAEFSHGLCRPCIQSLYPEFAGKVCA